MAQYIITHTTEYNYQEPIGLCQNIARLTPRNFYGQTCLHSEIIIDPLPDVLNSYDDFFGNHLTYYAIEQEHKKLRVTVRSHVEIVKMQWEAGTMPQTPWEDTISMLWANNQENIEIRQFVAHTAMTGFSPEIRDYAQKSFMPGRPLFYAAQALMQSIFHDFEFKPGATTVATPVDEVLRLRKGVCQDFAHLAIACVRSMGLPARYMSGYIETTTEPGKEKLIGADASHAWFSVFIPGIGWVGFDPTNNQIPSHQHITVAWGRDDADIAPLKGVIQSSRPHKLFVAVSVEKVK